MNGCSVWGNAPPGAAGGKSPKSRREGGAQRFLHAFCRIISPPFPTSEINPSGKRGGNDPLMLQTAPSPAPLRSIAFSSISPGDTATGQCSPSHTLSWSSILYLELLRKPLLSLRLGMANSCPQMADICPQMAANCPWRSRSTCEMSLGSLRHASISAHHLVRCAVPIPSLPTHFSEPRSVSELSFLHAGSNPSAKPHTRARSPHCPTSLCVDKSIACSQQHPIPAASHALNTNSAPLCLRHGHIDGIILSWPQLSGIIFF